MAQTKSKRAASKVEKTPKIAKPKKEKVEVTENTQLDLFVEETE